MPRSKVILRDCRCYDAEQIRAIVREGLHELGLEPRGRTLLKPNLVIAGKHFPHAFTRPEFSEGVLRALIDCDGGMSELAVGERSGITMPTRYAFAEAGYGKMLRRVRRASRCPVKMYPFDETPQVEIGLRHRARLRDSIFTPEPVARTDFFVNCPKFKAHPWTTVTFGMKNYIGIQDDRHRLLEHDHRLNEKVADLQAVLQPQLVVVDAITAGQGRMLTPLPFDLGLVILGNDQLALDAVCCRIVGLNPADIEHVALAAERGLGSLSPDDVELSGDVTLEQAQHRAEGFQRGLVRVEDYFEGSSIRAYAGPPPGDRHDYCWGGCPGALTEAIEILRVVDRKTDEKLPRLHIVFGNYSGRIEAEPGEKVVFVGDCARFEGSIAGRPVSVESLYVDRSGRSALEARSEDIFGKMLKVSHNLWKSRNDSVLRLPGCPVSVAEQILTLVHLGGLNNPYFDPAMAPRFVSCYLSMRTRQAWARLLGAKADVPGPSQRGAAATAGLL